MTDMFPHLDYKPKLPQRLDHGIGIIDRDRDKAERTAKEHEIGKICTSVEELLSLPEVEIVDIAVYPAEQVAIVEKAAAAGKHLLCQKPFADEYSKAVRSVELAE